MTTTQRENEAPTFDQLLAALPPRRRKFVAAYLQEPVATKAALTAGYSEKSARQAGHELLTFPTVRDAIEAGFKLAGMGPEEVLARTTEAARATLEDFLSIERLPYLETEMMDPYEAHDEISDRLADLSEELESASADRAEWIATEIKRLRRLHTKCERAMERTAPDGTTPEIKIGLVWRERQVVRLDLEKARAAGKLHLLKSYKETKYGPVIEFDSREQARELLGKHYRLWSDRVALENPDGTPIKFLVGIPEDAL